MSKVFNMVGGGGGPAASISVTGLSETNTVTATKGAKTLAGKWTQKPNPAAHGLPEGYTELEYIESTGTQYIDTGLVATPNTGFFLDFNMSSPFTSDDYQGIFGSYRTENYGTFSVSNYTKRFPGGQFSYGDGRYDAKLVIGERMQLEFKNSEYVSSVGASFSISPDAKVADTPSLYLFANHDTSVSGNIYGLCSALMYSAKFYEGENVVMDLVPTRRNSDNAIGLYDIVSGTFFENSGTGEFIAGAEVPQTIEGFLISKIKDFGTWTVTATDGTNTATQDVLVDVITEYTISLNIKPIFKLDFSDGTINPSINTQNTSVTTNGTVKLTSGSAYFNYNGEIRLTPPVFSNGQKSWHWKIKPSSISDYDSIYNDSDGHSSSGVGFAFYIGSNGSYRGFKEYGGGESSTVVSMPALSANAEYDIVVTTTGDTTTNGTKLYINGQLIGSGTLRLDSEECNGEYTTLAYNYASPYGYAGYIYLYEFYDRILSPDEILSFQ